MAFASVGIFSDCACAETSMDSTKMLKSPYEPQKLQFLIEKNEAANHEPESVPVSLKGDSTSFVCGNGDGISYCGSTGDTTNVYFTDEHG